MSKDIIAANLRRIRGAKSMSQDRLAQAAGLTRNAYSNIERAKSQPRVRTLEALAAALGVPLYQLLEPMVPLTEVRFRSQKKLRLRSQILSQVGRWLDDYNFLEELLENSRPFQLDGLSADLGNGTRGAEEVARAARSRLGLGPDDPVRDICGLLESAGIKVLSLPVQSDGFFGLSVGPGSGGPAVIVNTWEDISVERWIFTAAHELGHLLLHLDDYGKAEEKEDRLAELEADAFAAAFLMPDEVFRREWNDARGLSLVERVIKVKRIFRVSYKTVLHRIAPAYQARGTNIWKKFYTEHKRATGKSLTNHVEPEALTGSAFDSSAPEAQSSREPVRLAAGDFREDRLAGLVRSAVEAEEISLGRGGEILGLSPQEMRALAASWLS